MAIVHRPIIRQATRRDLEKFYGRDNVQQTMLAVVGIVRGRIVGCGGCAWVDGKVFVFCDLKPSARRYKVSIVKGAREIIEKVRSNGCRVMWAEVDDSEKNARRWVRSLGFKPTLKPNLYMWRDF